jgi:hypothetical protein
LCQARLHTTSNPETSGGKIKVPKIGVQQIHEILVFLLRRATLPLKYMPYFRHIFRKSKSKNPKVGKSNPLLHLLKKFQQKTGMTEGPATPGG